MKGSGKTAIFENWFLDLNREIITQYDEFSSTYYSLEVAAKNPFYSFYIF